MASSRHKLQLKSIPGAHKEMESFMTAVKGQSNVN